jgi:hypothetical protein
LARVLRLFGETDEPTISITHYLFFGGLLLTGFGSGYYYRNPSNEKLALDRLPMTVAFLKLILSRRRSASQTCE